MTMTSLVNAMTNPVFFGFPSGGCCACPASSYLDGALETYSGVGRHSEALRREEPTPSPSFSGGEGVPCAGAFRLLRGRRRRRGAGYGGSILGPAVRAAPVQHQEGEPDDHVDERGRFSSEREVLVR